MEITLEKIELVRDRTGVTYKEAKEALEAADGNVVDAIIAIESAVDNGRTGSTKCRKDALVSRLKEIIRKGNVSRILITKDGETILNLPLTAGIFGAIIAPWGMIAGVAASFGFKCRIEFVRDDGTVFDVSGKAAGVYDSAKEKGADMYSDLKEKGADIYSDFKEKAPDVYSDLKEKGSEVFGKAKDVASKAKSKITREAEDFSFDEFEEFAEDVAEDIGDIKEDIKDEVKKAE